MSRVFIDRRGLRGGLSWDQITELKELQKSVLFVKEQDLQNPSIGFDFFRWLTLRLLEGSTAHEPCAISNAMAVQEACFEFEFQSCQSNGTWCASL